MTTKKQAAANKRNAKRSTGPKTDGGKEISKMNAVKHALFVQPAILLSEDGQTALAYQKALNEQFRPFGIMERQVIRDIVVIRLRMDRLANYERTVGNKALLKPIFAKLRRISDPFEQKKLIEELIDDDHGFDLDIDTQLKISRHQTALDNQLKKKYDFLMELQARPFAEREDSKPETHWEDPIFDSMLIYEDRQFAIDEGLDPDEAERDHYRMRRALKREVIRFDLSGEDSKTKKSPSPIIHEE